MLGLLGLEECGGSDRLGGHPGLIRAGRVQGDAWGMLGCDRAGRCGGARGLGDAAGQ